MTITVLKEPNPYCFIGNAVSFQVQADSYDPIVVEIVCNGESQYTSYYPFQKGDAYISKFDISGFLYTSPESEEYPQGEMISLLSDFSIPYQAKIGEDYIFSGIAFKGGIDNQTFAVLSRNGYDIFSYRLDSYFSQFLFTTRTHSQLIKVRESELYPFVFIHQGLTISFKSESGNTITTPALSEGTICVLDAVAVRENFNTRFSEIPDKIEIWIAEEVVFTIQVMSNQTSEENYLIKFRNSLGAFEVVEVVGTANHEPELSDPDIYKSLTDFEFYSDRRDRLTLQDVIKVETGYKTKDEILFIRDMVCSNETYFIYPDGSYFRCNVSVDEIACQQKQVTPTSIPLIISNDTDSQFISPYLDWTSLISGIGIFDETFDETFE